jgi:hypothetical protein
LDPGIASLEYGQREIVSDLQRNSINWAILEDAAGIGEESTLQRLEPPGCKMLDEFFLANYHEVESFGTLSVVRRNQ